MIYITYIPVFLETDSRCSLVGWEFLSNSRSRIIICSLVNRLRVRFTLALDFVVAVEAIEEKDIECESPVVSIINGIRLRWKTNRGWLNERNRK